MTASGQDHTPARKPFPKRARRIIDRLTAGAIRDADTIRELRTRAAAETLRRREEDVATIRAGFIPARVLGPLMTRDGIQVDRQAIVPPNRLANDRRPAPDQVQTTLTLHLSGTGTDPELILTAIADALALAAHPRTLR